jgi:hypothetical protein
VYAPHTLPTPDATLSLEELLNRSKAAEAENNGQSKEEVDQSVDFVLEESQSEEEVDQPVDFVPEENQPNKQEVSNGSSGGSETAPMRFFKGINLFKNEK